MKEAHSVDRSLYTEIYDEVLEEVQRKNPTLDPHEQRLLTRSLFQERHYLPDMKSVQQEHSEVQYDSPTYVEVTPDGYARWMPSGRTFGEVHERALRLKPEIYDKQAHERDLLLESALVSAARRGERAFISYVSDFRDDTGVPRIRDIVTIELRGGKGQVSVHNIAPDGKFLSYEEARGKMRELFPESREMKAGPDVFVFTTSSIRAEVTAKQPQFPETKENRSSEVYMPAPIQQTEAHAPIPQIIRQTDETTRFVHRRVIADTKETVQSVRRWVAAKKIEATTTIFAKELVKQNKTTEHQSVKEAVTLHVARVRRRRRELVFVEKTGAARAAIPAVLRILSEEPPKAVRAVEKSMRRHQRKVREVQKVREVRKAKNAKERFLKAQSEKTKWVEPIKTRKNEKQKRKLRVRRIGGEVVSIRRKEKITKQKRRKVYMEHPAGSRIYTIRERSERVERRKKKMVIGNGVKKTTVAEKITLFGRENAKGKKRKVKGMISMRGREQGWLASQGSTLRSWETRSERSVLRRVRFAWLLYRRLHLAETQGVTFKNRRSPEERRYSLKRVTAHGGSPWILLSIMYQLTALREGGNGHGAPPPRRQFPKQAVIFAF